jgi:hypothetical protein
MIIHQIRLVEKLIRHIACIVICTLGLFQNCLAHSNFTGSIELISKETQQKMNGITWHAGCPVSLKDLVLLKVNYWGFDNKVHFGKLIVHRAVATDMLNVFRDLYYEHYRIEKIILPENLIKNTKATGTLAIAELVDNSNDTTAFFCRFDGQNPGRGSLHSYGTAIDINPFYNPAMLAPQFRNLQAGRKYLNRNLQHFSMIRENGSIVNIFKKYGWKWGGNFINGHDYMHFEKSVHLNNSK